MAILFHASPRTVAMGKRFDDSFRSEVEGTEAGRMKEKIYGYLEDVLESLREKRGWKGLTKGGTGGRMFDRDVGRLLSVQFSQKLRATLTT